VIATPAPPSRVVAWSLWNSLPVIDMFCVASPSEATCIESPREPLNCTPVTVTVTLLVPPLSRRKSSVPVFVSLSPKMA
jgi:hypothetical protein